VVVAPADVNGGWVVRLGRQRVRGGLRVNRG